MEKKTIEMGGNMKVELLKDKIGSDIAAAGVSAYDAYFVLASLCNEAQRFAVQAADYERRDWQKRNSEAEKQGESVKDG